MGRHIEGFTLIEILIVMVIIAFSISIVTLSIGGNKDESGTRKEAQAFLQAADFAEEDAILNGNIIGMFLRPQVTEDAGAKAWCYNWLRYRDNSWQPMPEETLSEHCMPANMQWDLVIEGRLYTYDPELEVQPPVLVFSPSGETTAVEMAIFEHGTASEPQRIEIDLIGNVHWRNLEEEEKRNGK